MLNDTYKRWFFFLEIIIEVCDDRVLYQKQDIQSVFNFLENVLCVFTFSKVLRMYELFAQNM